MIIKTLITVFLVMSFLACGGKKSSDPDLTVTTRNGSTLVKIDAKYVDDLPKLNADGTKVVFISGASSTDAKRSMRAYKSTWSLDGTISKPELVTKSDTGNESEVFISPDGTWIITKVANGLKSDLYLQPFEGSADAVAITADENVEKSISFSEDSKFVAFVSQNLTEGSSVKVLEIAEGNAAAIANLKTITSTNASNDQVTFNPVDTGYAVITAEKETLIDSLYKFVNYSFADSAAIEASTPEVLLENVNLTDDLVIQANGEYLLFGKRVLRSEKKMTPRSGNLVQDITDLVPVESEASFLQLSDNTASVFKNPPGIKLVSGSIGSETNAFYSILDPYKCTGDKKMKYTRGIVASKMDLSGHQRIIPRWNTEKTGWVLNTEGSDATGYCDLTSEDGALTRIDDKISYMNSSSNSASENYRIAYVSRFSTAFDKDCNLMTGDSEIRLLETKGGEAIITNVWAEGNQQEIASLTTTCTL